MNDYELKNMKIAKHYGFDNQSNQLIEECAELIQAINKYKRNQQIGLANIMEEMADVEVMLIQIRYLLGINPRYISGIMQEKIERQIKRIEGEVDDRKYRI